MKRVLVRMLALGTVVVLGWIAIAQAQRGVESVPAPAGGGFAQGDEVADSPLRGPTLAAAGTQAPRNFPAGVRANPLRPDDETPPTEYRQDGRGVYPAVGRAPSRYSGAEAAAAEQAGAAAGLRPAVAEQPVDPSPGAPSEGIGAIAPQQIATDGAVQGGHGGAGEMRPASPAEVAGGETSGEAATDSQPTPAAADPTASAMGSAPALGPPGEGAASGYGGSSRFEAPAEPAGAASAPRPLGNRPPHASRLQSQDAAASAFADGGGGTSAGLDSRGAALGDGSGLGSGTPGSKQLEGPQSPQGSIEKTAPAEIQVGKTASFAVKVRNVGSVPAQNVEIRDEVPAGTRLVSTSPRASRGASGNLVWELGTLGPGEEASVEMQVMPLEEGEIGSVATLHFAADASARTIVTKPELQVAVETPQQVLIGDDFVMSITLSNPGSGPATGVVLQERVPPQLQHAAGAELEYEVGRLEPGETRQLELRLTAARPGKVNNLLTAQGDANLRAEHQQEFEVIAPQLDIALEGPSRRYLEREATYELAVSNPGTAPANQVELVVYLPEGLDFVEANNAGHFEPTSRTVHWKLEELPSGETGSVELVAMPVEAGEYRLRYTGAASKGISVEKEHEVAIEGIAAILFEVVDVDDPVEAGGETAYEIRVLNQGSKAATNVQIVASLPEGMRPVAAEGPTPHTLQPNQVVFEGLARLAPKADTTYRIRVQGLQPGDQRVRVQLLTDQMQTPVTKEESTRVYSDE